MSDHRVQGMSLKNFIVDLRRPPDGKLKIENIYVMLSRATEWNDFAILCDFDDDIFCSDGERSRAIDNYNQYLSGQDTLTQLELQAECEQVFKGKN